MPVAVRVARPSEHAAVGAVTVAAYRGRPGGGSSEAYLAELADVASRAAVVPVLAALVDGEVLGGCTYVPGPGPHAEFDDADAAGLRHLAVAPAAQGRGVGRALLDAVVARAAAEGRARLVLHTTPAMTVAHGLYERSGFDRVPERDLSPPGVTLLAYVRELR